ncbi:hypothetical protein FGO68_gene9303 [Halteria grandinella]|uniref:Uncharacterized protein n=1 Tax=Halteria grandinella TaxID=5974 RepID=A0A8J8NV91_HALGN|nr:hypothetical protein FGO68_gene9303 [Halteria grandinella]
MINPCDFILGVSPGLGQSQLPYVPLQGQQMLRCCQKLCQGGSSTTSFMNCHSALHFPPIYSHSTQPSAHQMRHRATVPC